MHLVSDELATFQATSVVRLFYSPPAIFLDPTFVRIISAIILLIANPCANDTIRRGPTPDTARSGAQRNIWKRLEPLFSNHPFSGVTREPLPLTQTVDAGSLLRSVIDAFSTPARCKRRIA